MIMTTRGKTNTGKKKVGRSQIHRHVPYNLRRRHSRVCEALHTAPDVALQSLTVSLYSEGIIDGHTKAEVLRNPGYKGAAILMDSVDLHVQRDPQLKDGVLNRMDDQYCLRDIVQEIRSSKLMDDMESSSVSSDDTTSQTCKTKEEVLEDAKALYSKFDILLEKLLEFSENVAINRIQLKLTQLLKKEVDLPKEIHKILGKVDKKTNHVGIINYLVLQKLLGYLNHRLLDAFTNIIDNEQWNTLLEEYEAARNSFLKSTDLKTLAQVFHNHPSLAPQVPPGIPTFTVHLDSSWDNSTYYCWNELLEKQVNWPPFIYIDEINDNCIIIKYGVLPFFAPAVVRDFTDPQIVSVLEEQGVTKIDLSDELKQTTTGLHKHKQMDESLQFDQASHDHCEQSPSSVNPKVETEGWHSEVLLEKEAQVNKIWQAISPFPSSLPSLEQFVTILSLEPEWYTLGILLGAPSTELDEIGQTFRSSGIKSCITELHSCLVKTGKFYSWNIIINTLKRINNHQLAERIFQCLFPHHLADVKPHPTIPSESSQTPSHHTDITEADDGIVNDQYYILSTFLVSEFKEAFLQLKHDDRIKFLTFIEDYHQYLQPQQDDSPFNIDNLLDHQMKNFSYFHFYMLIFLFVKFFQDDKDGVLSELMSAVHQFNTSTKVSQIIDSNDPITHTNRTLLVKLKVRRFWHNLTLEQFNVLANEVFGPHYNEMALVSINEAGTCYTWVIPDVTDNVEFKVTDDNALFRIIGVVSVSIGDTKIYNTPQQEGCETIEAAMLQAVDLKNTRAVELLLSAGCDPQVVASRRANDVFNIIYMKEMKTSRTVPAEYCGLDHTHDHHVRYRCIIGQNEYLKAILDDHSTEPKCVTCCELKKMNLGLHQEIDQLRVINEEYSKLNKELQDKITLLEGKFYSEKDDSDLLQGDSSDDKQIIISSNEDEDQSADTKHMQQHVDDKKEIEVEDIKKKSPSLDSQQQSLPLDDSDLLQGDSLSDEKQIIISSNEDQSITEDQSADTKHMQQHMDDEKEVEVEDIKEKNNSLLKAVKQGADTATVSTLLKEGANIHTTDSNDYTPLHYAAEKGNIVTVELLLNEGATKDITTGERWYGDTPLHLAAKHGHDSIIEILVQYGANVDERNESSKTPLNCAASYGMKTTVELLLKYKADYSIQSKYGDTMLHSAAEGGNIEIVKLFLDMCGTSDLHKVGSSGYTPLHCAVKRKRHKIVDLLIKYGANVDGGKEYYLSPLHVAAFYDCVDIAELLLKARANVHSKDRSDARTPLHCAAQEGHERIVKLLLKFGANINEKDENGFTPLHLSVGATADHECGSPLPLDSRVATVEIFLSNGAKVNEMDYYGHTPLYYAKKEKHHNIVQILLQYGAKPVQPSHPKETTIDKEELITLTRTKPSYHATTDPIVDYIPSPQYERELMITPSRLPQDKTIGGDIKGTTTDRPRDTAGQRRCKLM